MDRRPIGVFDSGLGGLTAVKELEQVLPRESVVYFGDNGRVPYGSRSREIIRGYARQDMDFLMKKGVKAVLAACGTVSSVAADIGGTLPVPYFDVVSPTARAAAAATRTGRIGVIGTSVTVASGSYEKALRAADPSLAIFPRACPLFVPLVESGFISPEDPVVSLTVERYLAPLREQGVDTLILGCTHYPILRAAIGAVMGPGVVLIDSGREAALALAGRLAELDLLAPEDNPRQADYFVTDNPEGFREVAELFLGHSIESGLRRVTVE